jgi:hypothetical protein
MAAPVQAILCRHGIVDVLDGRTLSRKHQLDAESAPMTRRRDWRKIHHSPLFWVAVFLFLAAITIYVLTDDLSWQPRIKPPI